MFKVGILIQWLNANCMCVYHDQLEIQNVPLLMLFSGMQMRVGSGVLTCVGHSCRRTNETSLCVNTKETNHNVSSGYTCDFILAPATPRDEAIRAFIL